MLMLSGIQHIAFCERQWALCYMEMLWQDNWLTVEGSWMHRKADDVEANESRGDIVTLRSVNLASHRLGLYGIADVVELWRAEASDPDAVAHPKYDGRWRMVPVEYKHGRPKEDYIDEVQLCAQAICLEEQYGISIPRGCIYYGETRHRIEVRFDDALRDATTKLACRMHELYDARLIPAPAYRKTCRSCSIVSLCMPKEFASAMPVSIYLRQLEE
jgi:CRISPR-associated exonuclease Cas4